MNTLKKLLHPKVQQFIEENTNANLAEFLLKKSPFEDISIQAIAQQIKGRQVAQKKFPFLLQKGILFPPHLNLEQASSQNTAESKGQDLYGKSFLDLTCGLGIDAYFLSQNFEDITLIEQDKNLSDIVKHNWHILGKKARFINGDLELFLETNDKKFDLIYLDPARRDPNNNKKFLLEDLSPNLLNIQEKIIKFSNKIIVKLSPLIDLSALQKNIKFISKIDIISVKNETKEIALHIIPNFEGTPEIIARNLDSTEPNFHFHLEEEHRATAQYSAPLNYIYLPNSSVLKSGAFNLISEKFGLKKLHPNTHIYTSKNKLDNFPGRIFEVKEISIKSIKKEEQFNIISKNHPLSPKEIKKKYKLKDGGNHYLFFTQSIKGKNILVSTDTAL